MVDTWRWRPARWLLALLVLVTGVLSGPPAHADTGPWGWPLAGAPTVGRGFDLPASPYGAGHRGVDLLGVPGQLVLAAGGGRISYAGLLAGRGVLVVVHGGLRTTYEPVTALVGVGEVVQPGEPIGLLEDGHPGCPAFACLHWGLKRGEDYLDPLALVQQRPVRLLPLGNPGPPPAAARGPVTAGAVGSGPPLGMTAGAGALAGAGLAGAHLAGPLVTPPQPAVQVVRASDR